MYLNFDISSNPRRLQNKKSRLFDGQNSKLPTLPSTQLSKWQLISPYTTTDPTRPLQTFVPALLPTYCGVFADKHRWQRVREDSSRRRCENYPFGLIIFYVVYTLQTIPNNHLFASLHIFATNRMLMMMLRSSRTPNLGYRKSKGFPFGAG